MHLALGFFKTFQEASTGMQANANVKNAAVPVATHIAITMKMAILCLLTEKMRRYCVRIETLVNVNPIQYVNILKYRYYLSKHSIPEKYGQDPLPVGS